MANERAKTIQHNVPMDFGSGELVAVCHSNQTCNKKIENFHNVNHSFVAKFWCKIFRHHTDNNWENGREQKKNEQINFLYRHKEDAEKTR